MNGSVEMTVSAAGETGSECAMKWAVSIKQPKRCNRIDCGKNGSYPSTKPIKVKMSRDRGAVPEFGLVRGAERAVNGKQIGR